MTEPRVAAIIASTLLTVACGGFSTVAPTAPSATPASPVSAALTPAPAHSIGPDVPAGLSSNQQVFSGSVGPLIPDAAPCYLERYSCERYLFTMDRNGAVEVTLTWEGGERAMLIQLYRAGAGLVHEDLAPRGGPPTIAFRRTDLTATDYELRVVNMEPATTHAFNLTLTTWK
jgi:hypothetical protein